MKLLNPNTGNTYTANRIEQIEKRKLRNFEKKTSKYLKTFENAGEKTHLIRTCVSAFAVHAKLRSMW